MGVKKARLYTAVGYSYMTHNEHLIGVVGDTHTLAEWVRVVFPNSPEWAEQFFEGYTDADIVGYLQAMQGLRLQKNGRL